MAKVRKTTAADFALFRRTCLDCIRRWNVTGWRVEFRHEKLRNKTGQCATSVHDRAAWLSLSTEYGDDDGETPRLGRDDIVSIARHESAHLLLAPLADVVSARYLSRDHEREVNEQVCNHLVGLLP